MTSSLHLALVCPLALVMAAPVRASQQDTERLSATTRLVEFTVVAEDAAGNPVTDLTRDEFTILDKKHPEKIAFFNVERSVPTGGRPLPPDTFSNRFEQTGSTSAGSTVILFDGLNTAFVDQAYARGQIIKFLEQLTPGEPVGVYLMGRGPRVLQEVGGDTTALIPALKENKIALPHSLEVPLWDPGPLADNQFGAWLGELGFNLMDYFDRDRAFRTVRALTAIANHLDRLPGRKNLVWVSGSFPVSMLGGSIPALVRAAKGAQSGWPETDRLVRALNRAKVAIYPVDARGLMVPLDFDPARSGAASVHHLRDYDNFDVMRKLAERTGGRAVYNNNDLASAFAKALNDGRHAYVLGFYPSHNDWNSRFREVTIRVSRPDVKLHYRRGYFALPDEPQEPWYREATFDAAMYNPVDSSGIGITTSIAGTSNGSLKLDVALDSRGLKFDSSEGRWITSIDVWIVQFDSSEHHLKTDAHTVRVQLLPPEYERVMKAQGLRMLEQVKPVDKAAVLRLMVRDVGSGSFGSLTIPVRSYVKQRASE